jgi:hypothetical protein
MIDLVGKHQPEIGIATNALPLGDVRESCLKCTFGNANFQATL